MQPEAGFLFAWNICHHHTTGCVLPQERKANIATIQPAEAKTATIYRRIGFTTYKVRVHFSDTAQETINDKILRLIQREAVTNGADCGIITARKPEPLICQGFRLFLLLTCYKFNIKPWAIKIFFVPIQGRF